MVPSITNIQQDFTFLDSLYKTSDPTFLVDLMMDQVIDFLLNPTEDFTPPFELLSISC